MNQAEAKLRKSNGLKLLKGHQAEAPLGKKQRTDKEFKVMKRLEGFSRDQLLKIHKKVTNLLETKNT